MKILQIRAKRYTQRKNRVRSRVIGTTERPRLSVFRSNAHIYGQVIDDDKNVTVVSFSDTLLKKGEKMTKVQIAEKVGEELAKLAIAKKVKKVTFDRNGFRFHGRVKSIADGARKGGLDF